MCGVSAAVCVLCLGRGQLTILVSLQFLFPRTAHWAGPIWQQPQEQEDRGQEMLSPSHSQGEASKKE